MFSVAEGQDQVDQNWFSARMDAWNRDSSHFIDKKLRDSRPKIMEY